MGIFEPHGFCSTIYKERKIVSNRNAYWLSECCNVDVFTPFGDVKVGSWFSRCSWIVAKNKRTSQFRYMTRSEAHVENHSHVVIKS